MEHRWGERVGVDIAVRIVAHPFVVRHGRLTNMSVSGASLQADFELRPLSRIQVCLEIPHRARCEAPNVAAYVTRSTKEGIGIEWCEFAPRVISEFLQSFTARRHSRLRKPDTPAAVTLSRLSPPLLKHGT